jgi:predicted nucleic acid-binding protein
MPFIVLYDANALYGNAQRDLLIRIARAGLVQGKWTDEILAEMCRARKRKNPELEQEKLDLLCQRMREAVAGCMVTGYEDLIENLKLPDADDRHVLAAAVRANAQVIVTANIKHFPADYLAQFDVEAKLPDDFVLDQLGINDSAVFACIQQIADTRDRPPNNVPGILEELERSGLVRSAAALRAMIP